MLYVISYMYMKSKISLFLLKKYIKTYMVYIFVKCNSTVIMGNICISNFICCFILYIFKIYTEQNYFRILNKFWKRKKNDTCHSNRALLLAFLQSIICVTSFSLLPSNFTWKCKFEREFCHFLRFGDNLN